MMNTYSPIEEKMNIYSHFLGAILAALALVLLVIKGAELRSAIYILSHCVFGLSLLSLYIASTLYHSASESKIRNRFKIYDHCAIYVLIAGTYTPYVLNVLGGEKGWIFFGFTWAIALIGIVLKLFFTGRFKAISTLMYILMGWMIVFFVKDLLAVMPPEGFYWLLAGGISYTLGALLYLIKKIPFNHAIFHLFVFIGSICHFVSIYIYV